MSHPFDPGYGEEPYRTLCAEYPEKDVYPFQQFRVEWGPIFHRGRLDGSARVLVIGQDPAQHETIVRRILVGEAGRRIQGFLAKLGILKSYVFINTYLYSVFGSVRSVTRKDPRLVDYRNRWLSALLHSKKVEAVIALGQAADEAWSLWKATPEGQVTQFAFAAITHPTEPESSSKGVKAKLAAETTKLLKNWNQGLRILVPSVLHPDLPNPNPAPLYGQSWVEGDRVPIPEADFPAGLPPWMHENDGWARRVGADEKGKRSNLTVTVPKGILP